LLRFEKFDPQALATEVNSSAAHNLSDCDTNSQTALLLAEMRLAETALKNGELQDFEAYTQSIESRARRAVSCAPRSSYIWLLAFSVGLLHGNISDNAFALLAMSYHTSPNEAWIAIRRNIVAVPLLLVAPPRLQLQILSEFEQLIRNGFQDEAARSYLNASAGIRSLLQPRIEQLDPSSQKRMLDAINRSKS
jgi:hypothetical protein